VSSLAWSLLIVGGVVLLIALGVAVAYWNLTRNSPRGQFALAGASSLVLGLLLGAAAVFGVTLMVQQDKKPPLSIGDGASILNRVEYGNRS
jgi:hypothetical protein